MALFKRAFLDQALGLPIGPLGVLFGKRRHAHHAAMAPFPPQPPQKPALKQFGVQPIGLGPAAELVKEIPADTWKILQEIQKRRPAMMLHELLDKRERAPKQPPNAQAPKVVIAS